MVRYIIQTIDDKSFGISSADGGGDTKNTDYYARSHGEHVTIRSKIDPSDPEVSALFDEYEIDGVIPSSAQEAVSLLNAAINFKSGGGASGSLAVADDHIFATAADRDAYFTSNPDEQKVGLYISTAGELQKWDGAVWVDMSSVVRGEKGDQGDPGTPGASAYEAAVSGGYEGTEEEFGESMSEVGRAVDGLDVEVLTDLDHSSSSTDAKTTLQLRNLLTTIIRTIDKQLPIASENFIGMMTPEVYRLVAALDSRVALLEQLGGRFIGVSFPTNADAMAYQFADTDKFGDFSYIEDDETHDDATTRIIIVDDGNGNRVFRFAYVINYDPIGIATLLRLGLVLSTEGVAGKGYIEQDGSISVWGWNDLMAIINGLTNPIGIIDYSRNSDNSQIWVQLSGTPTRALVAADFRVFLTDGAGASAVESAKLVIDSVVAVEDTTDQFVLTLESAAAANFGVSYVGPGMVVVVSQ